MAAKRSGLALIAILVGVAVVVWMLAGGRRALPPLQSPVETPTLTVELATPTSTLVPTVAPPTPTFVPTFAPPTPTFVPTFAPPTSFPSPTFGPSPTPSMTPTPGPSPTPDMRATSESVIATITAQAIPPTYPPTSAVTPAAHADRGWAGHACAAPDEPGQRGRRRADAVAAGLRRRHGCAEDPDQTRRPLYGQRRPRRRRRDRQAAHPWRGDAGRRRQRRGSLDLDG